MDNMLKQYKNILKNLEKNIQNKDDLEYIKTEISNLFMLFFNEVDSLKDLYETKIETILDRQSVFEDKINNIQNSVNNIEKDIYMEDEGSDLEIICPYCEYEFLVGIEEIHNDIECPECKNLIELEWNEDEKCSGSCGSCKGHCDDDDDDNNEEEEDVL